LIEIVGLLFFVAGSAGAGLGIYLVALAIAALFPPRRVTVAQSAPAATIAVIVPAHNEERLIARCIASLRAQDYPARLYRTVVVADNCSDRTAEVAANAGAEVMSRTSAPGARGKGQALRWAMDALLSASHPPDAVVVVDADSVCDPGMLTALQNKRAEGHQVVQADYSLFVEVGSPRSELVGAAFLLFHRVRFTGRARLGMAANLVGNGMLFSRAILDQHPWSAFTGTEDLEYSLQLRLHGVAPAFAPEARVSGPGSATRSGAVHQRLRWEGGRFHAVRAYLWPLVRTAAVQRDPRLLDAALDLATPPLSLLAIALAAGATATAATIFFHAAPAWAIAPWLVGLACVLAFVLIGLRAVRAPGSTWRALARTPVFLGWKAMTYIKLARGFDASLWVRTDRMGEARSVAPGRVDVAGVPIDTVDMLTAVSRVGAAIGSGRLFHVSTVNLDFVVRAQTDPEVRRIFQRGDLNIADGAPVVWLSRILGANLAERVAGADFVPAVIGQAAATGARVFLLGGEGGVADLAAARLQQLHPGLVIAGTHEPPRARLEDMDSAAIVAELKEARPDLLLVALGHPKQERWIDLHRAELPPMVAIGVGCVLDLMAGKSQRAPGWMQRVGLEWLYRLAQEPGRLLGRYATDAVWLVPIALRALGTRLSGKPVAEAA